MKNESKKYDAPEYLGVQKIKNKNLENKKSDFLLNVSTIIDLKYRAKSNQIFSQSSFMLRKLGK